MFFELLGNLQIYSTKSYSESYPDYRKGSTSLHKYPDISTKCFFLRVQAFSQTQNIFYRCTVLYGIYILFIHQQLHFLLNLEKF